MLNENSTPFTTSTPPTPPALEPFWGEKAGVEGFGGGPLEEDQRDTAESQPAPGTIVGSGWGARCPFGG